MYNVEPPNEIIVAACKKDQAIGRAFKEVRGFTSRNPALSDEMVRMTDRLIELKNRSTITAIQNDFSGEAESNHGLVTFDELWGYTTERDQRLYDELTPVPTRKNSIRFITTYAGYQAESALLEDLYHQIFRDIGRPKLMVKRPLGKNFPCNSRGPLFVYWDHTHRMPWQTKEYYESQKVQLRANTYLRLHENRWVSSEVSMFKMDRWDECTDPDHKPPMPDKNLKLWVGVDASVKRDRSAVVSVYKDGDSIILGPKRFWQPSAKSPMDLEVTMEAFLLELSKNYSLINCYYDPFQFHRSATTLLNQGLPMREFIQSTTNLIEAGQNLYDLVEYKNIVFYECKDLRYEATCAVAKSTDRGLRIVKDKSSHKIDQIIALAMAALPAAKELDTSGFEIKATMSELAVQFYDDL